MMSTELDSAVWWKLFEIYKILRCRTWDQNLHDTYLQTHYHCFEYISVYCNIRIHLVFFYRCNLHSHTAEKDAQQAGDYFFRTFQSHTIIISIEI